jgi:hypothetical protein
MGRRIWEQPQQKMVRVNLGGDASDDEGCGCELENWEQPRNKMVRVNLWADDVSDEEKCGCCDDEDEEVGRGR